LHPALDSGDEAVGMGGPHEGFRIGMDIGEEVIDGGLEVNNRSEDGAFEPPPCQPR
jgi:hypothetical protein